ncbi:unnamed protein product [Polarella glacialis]|uniref:Uncharacterized protein n=1 Tax=Polarella glacialis TaxID=89957 RepID=A0A813HSN7_POLGL|nr:unnamed protein product [Polarella glacialis]CAE8641371.1 unnamed protein product [Polarella glacialis]
MSQRCRLMLLKYKRTICWAGFMFPWLLEVYVHLRCGIGNHVFDREDSKEIKFITLTELVCRTCLVVVLAGMLWDFSRAALHCQIGKCIRVTYVGGSASPYRTLVPAIALSLWTLGVGIWGVIVGDHGLPLWAEIYCHFADVFCHAIIVSALLGICVDFSAAAVGHRLTSFLTHFLLCTDTIEAHGVTGLGGFDAHHPRAVDELSFAHTSRDQEQCHAQHRLACSALRAVYIWAVFLVTLWAYILDSFFVAPLWMRTLLDFLGRLCWTGISWWITVAVLTSGTGMTGIVATVSLSHLGLRTFDMERTHDIEQLVLSELEREVS